MSSTDTLPKGPRQTARRRLRAHKVKTPLESAKHEKRLKREPFCFVRFVQILRSLCMYILSAKGQFILKCPFGVIVSTKIPMKALASKKRSNQKKIPNQFLDNQRKIKCLYFFYSTSFWRLEQKSFKKSRQYFGRNDDTKRKFRNQLTLMHWMQCIYLFNQHDY